jgi:predicted metal-binding membrane protein
VLWRYRQAVDRGERARGPHSGVLTVIAGVAYFVVWTAIGAAVFPLGVALAAVEMREPTVARLIPIAAGVVVLLAGALQLTAWKARYLACCREEHWRGRVLPARMTSAWRQGARLAVHCACCGAGPTAVLLALGVMDLRVMAVIAIASTVERVAPEGLRAARTIGIVAIVAGLVLVVRAGGFG